MMHATEDQERVADELPHVFGTEGVAGRGAEPQKGSEEAVTYFGVTDSLEFCEACFHTDSR